MSDDDLIVNASRAPIGTRQRAVLDVLEDWGGLHEADIAAEAGLSVPDTRRAIASLYARSLVHRLHDGRWCQGAAEVIEPPRRRRTSPPRWPVERAAYAYVQGHPGAPLRQVVREVVASRGSVREAIQRMQARGLVVVERGCAWATL